MLISNLAIISIYIEKKALTDKLSINPFKSMNQINKNTLSYLKTKYPRAKNLPTPFEL